MVQRYKGISKIATSFINFRSILIVKIHFLDTNTGMAYT